MKNFAFLMFSIGFLTVSGIGFAKGTSGYKVFYKKNATAPAGKFCVVNNTGKLVSYRIENVCKTLKRKHGAIRCHSYSADKLVSAFLMPGCHAAKKIGEVTVPKSDNGRVIIGKKY